MLYMIEKTFEVAGAHHLILDYTSKCQTQHGHNWIITIYCKSVELNQNGMVIDFGEIKKIVHKKMDHKNLNEVFDFNPTAENIAEWIIKKVPYCYKAKVQESENNIAIVAQDESI